MNTVLQALEFAKEKHKGQVRKVSGDEYITHPLKVSYLLASYKKSKNMNTLLCAALLHDTLEDTDTTFAELSDIFGEFVSTLVFELSNDNKEINEIGKRDYQLKKMIHMSSYGLTIKLVDRLANISDNPTDQMKKDTLYIIQNLVAKRKLTKTQKNILIDIVPYCE